MRKNESDTQRYEGKEKQNGFTTPIHQSPLIPNRHIARSVSSESYNSKNQVQVLSPAYNCRVLANKKRVVKMLFVVVLEYFLCWTPLYLCNSWATLDYNSARNTISPLTKTVILSLSYLSSCIHPITYCFMNRRFRQSFVDAFNCCSRGRQKGNAFYSEASQHNGSIAQVNKSTMSKHSKVTWKRHR
ncbi:cholecystokinin receptor type A [Biomphalaria glabrata]|nr:cholecystokinin receptor type A [Biomphalaria glabrata]